MTKNICKKNRKIMHVFVVCFVSLSFVFVIPYKLTNRKSGRKEIVNYKRNPLLHILEYKI